VTERAFIALGSNIDPEKNLPLAAKELHRIGTVLSFSSVYQSPAIGRPDHPDFLNAAALVETALSPLEIRNRLRKIEEMLGRVRTADKFAPRRIDLDLCLLGPAVLRTREIELPDPDIVDRACLAVPLAELEPGFRHPVTEERLESIAERLRADAALTPRPDVILPPVGSSEGTGE
jgi:2-amino-4-hydroxy-6-hydroxymethyldihydropteridine diphosphokinase